MRLHAQDTVRMLLGLLAPDEVGLLREIAHTPCGVAADRLSGTRLERLLGGPWITADASGAIRLAEPAVAEILNDAIEHAAPADGPAGRHSMPAAVQRIASAQHACDHQRALALFARAGGPYFIHFHGQDTFLEILRGFPARMIEHSELLVSSFAMFALKTGDLNRARHLLATHFGEEAIDLARLLANRHRHSAEFCLFRFVMTIYEEDAVSDDLRPALFDFLAEFEPDDHLHRGSFYNAMLDLVVRAQQYEAAREIATRARFHYDKADIPILVFYIDLYLAIIDLHGGATARAEIHAANAGVSLARVGFECENDRCILSLLVAVIRYEQGDSRPLMLFLNDDFEQFVHGEVWPTLAELAITYGSQVLARQIALPAARDYLDKWRVQEWRSNRFRLLIALREVALLQNGNRWQEAADLLEALRSRIGRAWVEKALDELSVLSDPNEVALAIAWLRQLIWEAPSGADMPFKIKALLENHHVGERERARLLVLAAYLARRHRQMTRARMDFGRAIEIVERIGSLSPLYDESAIVGQLLNDTRIGRLVVNAGKLRQLANKLSTIAPAILDGAQKAGLTGQEIKVLTLVVEGGSNKHVARQLGLAEVTVKFHLSNVYRKLGCKSRGEAIATARALRWVA